MKLPRLLTLLLPALALGAWCEAAPVPPREGDLRFAHLFHFGFPSRASGNPASVRALIQRADGSFWVGGPNGIEEFNGLTTTSFAPDLEIGNSSHVTRMIADDAGRIWWSVATGDVVRWRPEEVRRYSRSDGLPPGSPMGLFRDTLGVYWAANRFGVARLEGDRWRSVAIGSADTSPEILGGFADRDGAIWIATEGALFRATASTGIFSKVAGLPLPTTVKAEFAQTSDGSVWIADGQGGVFRLADPHAPLPTVARHFPDLKITRLMADRVGNLWMGGQGLHLLSAPRIARLQESPEPLVEAFDTDDGLTGQEVHVIYEDPQGLVWVATEGGIDRFFHSEFVGFALPAGLRGTKTLLALKSGSLWLSDHQAAALLEIRDDEIVRRFEGHRFTMAARDTLDRAWFAGPRGAARVDGDRLVHFELPAEVKDRPLAAMAVDRSGWLWLSVVDVGVFAMDRELRWHRNGNRKDLPHRHANAMLRDDDEDLWFAYGGDLLVEISALDIRETQVDPGLFLGQISALAVEGSRVWIGGELEMGILEGGRIRKMTARRCPHFENTTMLIPTRMDGYWSYRGRQLVQIPRSSMDEFLAGRSNALTCNIFNTSESMPGELQSSPTQPMAETTDDRLWLAVGGKLLHKDLKTPLVVPPAPVPVIMTVIEQSSRVPARLDNLVYEPGPDMVMGPGLRSIRFRFSASQLWSPSRLRFQFRLVGVDDEWQHTRSLWQAQYTHLEPGDYRFQVKAHGSMDSWSEPVEIRFSVKPYFHESFWFYLLCGLAATGIIALLFQLQLRRVSNRLRARLNERLLERERIARELHDTLLQGFQGLILRFQGATSRIAQDQPARRQFELLLDEADQVLLESRDRVSELRQSPHESGELPEAIADAARKLAQDQRMETRVQVTGTPRHIDVAVHAETFLIAREALSNAVRHSGATVIEIQLDFERTGLRLTIRDDGEGIDETILRDGGKTGHWGLQGMRERAKRLRATLTVSRRREGGSEVDLRIPASVAFTRD